MTGNQTIPAGLHHAGTVERQAFVELCHDSGVILALSYLPVLISLVLLSAHFVRSGNLAGVLLPIALMWLLALRRPWVARLTQLVLVLGALEWARTLVMLSQSRIVQGQPVTRLALILGVIIALAILSAMLFQAPPLRRQYKL